MAEWQYRVIRYSPDMARGERINIGVCLFDGKRYRLRFASPKGRVRYLDPHFDESLLADLCADLETHAEDSSYLEERITAFDPTFAFSEARTVLNGQPPDEVLEELYRRLVHMPLPVREERVPQAHPRRATVARQFLERLQVPREKIRQRVNPTKTADADFLGLRQPFPGEAPIVTACIPNGQSVVLIEPLLIATLAPNQVFEVGDKYLFYEEKVQPLARKNLRRAILYLGPETNGGASTSLLRLSKMLSERCAESVCDETDPKSVAGFRAWLWEILREAPLFAR